MQSKYPLFVNESFSCHFIFTSELMYNIFASLQPNEIWQPAYSQTQLFVYDFTLWQITCIIYGPCAYMYFQFKVDSW